MDSNGYIDEIFPIDQHPPTCPKCKQIFTFRYQLEWHFQWKHPADGKLLVCGECNLASVGDLLCQLHLDSYHHQNSRCACEKCGVRFETDFELRKHHLVHREQRAHVCDMCSKSFALRANLERHTKLNCSGAKALLSSSDCRSCFSRRSFMRKHSTYRDSDVLV